ncbi:efflux RND transporter periplasmic adaptor subunit [Terrarubrum flagellatum]|uniref:efflux RND transporter periplasmic adaptor subunit n=1 Tax=Terrirubrum flagellatum TaxID=2895980 RepID=UPI0031452777
MLNRLPTAIALLSTLALAACNEATPKTEAKIDGRPVLVEKVVFAPLTPERTFVASVRPRFESDLGFRVAGKVARRLVDVGAVVKAGDALALLDDADLKLQREQADAEFGAATGALAQANAELKRAADLRAKGWSTDSTADARRAAVDEAKGRLTRAERAVSLAKNSLDYTVLRADADGVVTGTSIEAGQVVAAGAPAIRVARTAEREALIAIPEAMIERVRTGKAKVALWAAPDRVYDAKLRELSPAADAATRTYAARFTLEGAGVEAQWGMTATVAISEKDNPVVARLPLSSLANQGEGPTMYVVDKASGALSKRPVNVLRFDAQQVLVTGGVNNGEFVVALGVQKLDPAQKVRVVDALAF